MYDNNNFNAVQLNEIYGIFEEMKSAFRQLEYAGCGGTEAFPNYEIYNLISSGDSSLSHAWKNSSNIVCSISEKANYLLSNIKDELEKYISATITNEENITSIIASINKQLELNKQALDQIDI